MKKVCLFTLSIILSTSFFACKDTVTNIDNQQGNESEIYDINALIETQKEGFDNSDLESALKYYVLEQEYRQLNDGEKQNNEVLIAFGEDNKAMMLTKQCVSEALKDDDGNYLVDAHGNYAYKYTDVYYHSRECSWSFDTATNIITTTDEYGIEYKAEVVYYDGKKLIYGGMICDEFTAIPTEHLGFDYLTLVTLTEDRTKWDEWLQKAISFDCTVRYIASKEDKRLNWMLQMAESANGIINDELFVETLLSKVFYFGYDAKGTESGYLYGDPGVYYNVGGVWYWKLIFEGGHYPSTYVMMEDGTLRECYTYYNGAGDPEMEQYSDKEVYYATKWSYDAATNTLHTNGNSEAEVLYFDGEIAVLKGLIDKFPYQFGEEKYGLFYVDFTKLERKDILDKYNLCLNDLM